MLVTRSQAAEPVLAAAQRPTSADPPQWLGGRRLLYVGMTRARQSLTLTHCSARMRYGSASPCAPSSFLKEIDGRFV